MDKINIKVVGIGGGGGSSVAYMADTGLENVDFMVIHTDKSALDASPIENKILLGGGTDIEMDPAAGESAALANYEEIKTKLHGADLILIIAAFGGATGTGAAPIVARAAKKVGALAIPIVTTPFKFEGRKRRNIANQGIEDLLAECGLVIVVPNEEILSMVLDNLGIREAFYIIDKLVCWIAGSITKSMVSCGEKDVCLDLENIKAVLGHKGIAWVGTSGYINSMSATSALEKAIGSPLLHDVSLDEAKGILVHFDVHSNYSYDEIVKAMEILKEHSGEGVLVKFSVSENKCMDPYEYKAALIAVGFDADMEVIAKSDPRKCEQDEILDVPVLLKRA
ncbi:cell division protein FtsZ [Sulfurovum sp. NBC37-1]|uniref:cell division protein FtsZ n=1 Tax=Sulfurovum sp. (strain NBC37-1) TaxID=387093 RepID=UPI000158797D|nr:cell division protein FtsZ [Sulfurovum sp. NBC37-1]BAF73236.1 cell division protein FtsZ [Sulfurovum sp. NBC37-1]